MWEKVELRFNSFVKYVIGVYVVRRILLIRQQVDSSGERKLITSKSKSMRFVQPERARGLGTERIVFLFVNYIPPKND